MFGNVLIIFNIDMHDKDIKVFVMNQYIRIY